MEADDLLCSRNARPEKALVRRPQSKAPYALAWRSIELKSGNEWTRAVGDQSVHSLGEARARNDHL